MTFSQKPLLIILFSVAFLALSCASTERMSSNEIAEVNNRTYEQDKNEVYQAALGALNRTGFSVNRSNPNDGVIEAVFRNRDRSEANEDAFFGYHHRITQNVRAEMRLISNGDATQVVLNLIEVYPPSPAQYGRVRLDEAERQLLERKYYEGLLDEINEILTARATI